MFMDFRDSDFLLAVGLPASPERANFRILSFCVQANTIHRGGRRPTGNGGLGGAAPQQGAGTALWADYSSIN